MIFRLPLSFLLVKTNIKEIYIYCRRRVYSVDCREIYKKIYKLLGNSSMPFVVQIVVFQSAFRFCPHSTALWEYCRVFVSSWAWNVCLVVVNTFTKQLKEYTIYMKNKWTIVKDVFVDWFWCVCVWLRYFFSSAWLSLIRKCVSESTLDATK